MYPLAKIWFMTEAGYDYDKKKNLWAGERRLTQGYLLRLNTWIIIFYII